MAISVSRFRPATYTLIAITVVTVILAGVGITADVRSFDSTSGGYELPYTDYTGQPIDRAALEATETGVHKPGYVVDVHANWTTGMIYFEVLGIVVPFREFSPRALAVHKPRKACTELGFDPKF